MVTATPLGKPTAPPPKPLSLPTPDCLSHLVPSSIAHTPVLYWRHVLLHWPSHLLAPPLILLMAGHQSEDQSTQNAPACLRSRRLPLPRHCAALALLSSVCRESCTPVFQYLLHWNVLLTCLSLPVIPPPKTLFLKSGDCILKQTLMFLNSRHSQEWIVLSTLTLMQGRCSGAQCWPVKHQKAKASLLDPDLWVLCAQAVVTCGDSGNWTAPFLRLWWLETPFPHSAHSLLVS